jgi:hypothetical protein
MKVINTATAKPAIMSTLDRLALYSGMDNLTLFEIRDGIAELMDDTRWATYRFEMELQAALLDMSFTGIPVDQQARRKMQDEFNQIKVDLTEYLNTMLEAIGYFDYYINMARNEFSIASGIPIAELPIDWDEWKSRTIQWRRWVKQETPNENDLKLYQKALKEGYEFNPNSPVQKLKLYYHFFGHPDNSTTASYLFAPPWLKAFGIKEHKGKKTNGTYGPTTNRDALEKVIAASTKGERYAAYWASPFAKVCLEISDVTKSLGFLNCKLDNGIFRSSFGVVTETGRLNSNKNPMDFGSNAQNITPKLRHVLTCPQGWKIAAPDYEQIESRNVGAICFVRFDMDAYLAASECGDLHTLVCSMVWEDMPWPEDFNIRALQKNGAFPKDMVKAAKKIAGGIFYRHFTYRDAVKRLGHGSNYMGKPAHMSTQTRIPKPLIEHFQDNYFEAFPEIPRWHDWVAEIVQIEGEITTLLGRARRFFGRPNEDKTIREAVAYEPQSMGADYTNRALLDIHKAAQSGELPIKIFLQKHDEIGFRFLEENEDKVIPIVRELMENKITLTSPSGRTREWYVPTEFESGWNLGVVGSEYYAPNGPNPNGLAHVDSSRVRIKPKHWSNWKL